MKLILTGFMQIFFVALNTLLIAAHNYVGVIICSFIISFIWTYNVKKVVFGEMKERILYASGAAIGGLSALLIFQQ